MRRPIIGLTCNELDKENLPKQFINEAYIHSVIRAGGCPMILPITNDYDTIQTQVNILDGLIVTGGIDVNPMIYNENPEPLHALPAGQFYADPERRPSETGIRAQPLHTASGRDVGNHRGDGAPGLGRQRLHDHPVSAPERAPLALRATDLAALPVRQRRPARHDDLLFQPQTSAPTLPHITY